MAREAEANFVIKGRDATGPAVASAKRGLQSISQQLQTLQNISFAGVGIYQLAAAVGAVHTAALEAERSSNALNATLKATGNAAGLTKGQIEGLVDELTNSTLFDDESLRTAAAALLRFRDIQEDVFRDALRMAPDLATALGTDVASAAQTLGKALTNPESGLKGLKAAGLALSEQQGDLAKKLLETGDHAGAARVVLDELKKSIGGSAGEANTGLSKATSDTKKAWDELLESIGNTAAYQSGAKDSLYGLTQLFKDLKTEIEGGRSALRDYLAMMADKALFGVFDVKFFRRMANGENRPGPDIGTREHVGRIGGGPGTTPDKYSEQQKQDAASKSAAARRKEAADEAEYSRRKKAQEEAAKTAKADAAKRAGFIESVQKERDKLILGEEDSKLKEAEKLGVKGADLERVKVLLQEIDARKALLAAAKENNEEFDREFSDIERQRQALEGAIKSRREMSEEVQLEYDLMRESEPVRKARIEMLDLERAGLERNSAAWEQIYEATLKAERQRDEIRKFGDEGRDAIKELQRAVEGWGKAASETFVDWAFGAKTSISDVVSHALKEFAQMQAYNSLFKPAFSAGSDWLKGLFGGGSGGGLSAEAIAGLAAFGVSEYAQGTNYVPNDGLAYLHKGEAVVPVEYNGRSGGGYNVTVNVDATGGSVQGDAGGAADLGRRIEGAIRSVLVAEKRPGGLLAA